MLCLNVEQWTAILTLIAVVIALVAVITSTRYQLLTLINMQLADKAKEANSYLKDNVDLPIDAGHISGMLSSIITARQILNYHLKKKYKEGARNKFLVSKMIADKQAVIDQYYLQLHTSIRVLMNDKRTFENKRLRIVYFGYTPGSDKVNADIVAFDDALLSCRHFLSESVKRENWFGRNL